MPQHHRVVARVGNDIAINDNRICIEDEEYEIDEAFVGEQGSWGELCTASVDTLWDRYSTLILVNSGGSSRSNKVFSPYGLVMRLASDLLTKQAGARHSTITVSILSHSSDQRAFNDLLVRHPHITSKVKLRTTTTGYNNVIGASEKLLESTDDFLDILQTAVKRRKPAESMLVRFNFILYYGMQRLDAHLDVVDPPSDVQVTPLTPFQTPKSYPDSDLNTLLSHYFVRDEEVLPTDAPNGGTSDPTCSTPVVMLLLDEGTPDRLEAVKKFAQPYIITEKESILSTLCPSPNVSPRREVRLPESATTPPGSIANVAEHKYSVAMGRLDATEKLVLKLELELSTKAAQHRHLKQTNLQLKQDLEDLKMQSKLLADAIRQSHETEAGLRDDVRDRDKTIRKLEIESFAVSQEVLEMKGLLEAERKKTEALRQQLAPPPSVTGDSCGTAKSNGSATPRKKRSSLGKSSAANRSRSAPRSAFTTTQSPPRSAKYRSHSVKNPTTGNIFGRSMTAPHKVPVITKD